LQFGKIDITEGQFVVMAVMLVSSISSFLDMDIWNVDVSFLPENDVLKTSCKTERING
jgi:hypothetical protein